MGYPPRYRSYHLTYSSQFPPGVKWLIFINAGIFVFNFLIAGTPTYSLFLNLFGLTPRLVLEGFAFWQLFTYLFLHSVMDFWHILLNMFMLWMFGKDLENTWGTRRFLQYYFLCGIGAGVCVVIGNATFGNLDTRTIGASGAIFGLLLAFGLLFPEAIILFSFLIPIKAKYYVMIFGAIEFLSTIRASGSGVSHVAHLGGMIFGYLYLRARFQRFSLRAWFRRTLHEYRVRRAKKRFEVYMRKRRTGDGSPWN